MIPRSHHAELLAARDGSREPDLRWSIAMAPVVARAITLGLASPDRPDPLPTVSIRRTHRAQYGCFSGTIATSTDLMHRLMCHAASGEEALIALSSPWLAAALFAAPRACRAEHLHDLPESMLNPTLRWFERTRGRPPTTISATLLQRVTQLTSPRHSTRSFCSIFLAGILGVVYPDEMLVIGRQSPEVLNHILSPMPRNEATAAVHWLAETLGPTHD